MAGAHRIWTDPNSVSLRLAELGLEAAILLEAAGRGLSAFAACTPHHPRNFPAMASWAEAMRGLRDILIPRPFHWTSTEDNGQPQVHNPNGSIALTVAGGDENVGREGPKEPRTSASKGYTTVRAMAVNAFLFPEMEADFLAKVDANHRRQTWFLLIHRDKNVGEMRCELSLPITMSEDRHINGWAERILLPSTSFDASVLRQIPDEPIGFTEEIDINIRRKA